MRRFADLYVVDSNIQCEGARTVDGNLACHSAVVVVDSDACDICTVDGLPIFGIRNPDRGRPVGVADVIGHNGDVKPIIFEALEVDVAINVNECDFEEISDSCSQLCNVL